jgi:hypothetical protein
MEGINVFNVRTNPVEEMQISSGSGRDRVLDYYTDFRKELANLMTNMMDENEDLELGGRIIPAEQKAGAAGTYLINSWVSDQEFVFSQLLESFKFEQSLENKINNLSFT